MRLPNAIVSLPCLLFAAAFCAVVGNSEAQTAATPSFDCSKTNVTEIESAICADHDLESRDRAMAELYAAVRASAVGVGLSQEPAAQRAWLKLRDTGCAGKPTAKCLGTYYDERLKELAVAALFSKPDVALDTLKRLDLKSAPLYEAIYRYATIDDPTERTAAVEKLIGPIFDAIHDKPWAQNLFSDIPTAHSAASSDDNFGTFLDVASVSDLDITLPCAALVRRPGLSSALEAKYGGAIDGHLPQTDCEATLPELPALAKLEQAAMDAQPPCQGTIRFSMGRDYMQTVVAVRLHRLDIDRPDDGSSEFSAAHRALADGAKDELTKYYTEIFKVEPHAARNDAIVGIDAVLRGAFNICDGG